MATARLVGSRHVEPLISALYQSGRKTPSNLTVSQPRITACITGGGGNFFRWMLEKPGASSTLLEGTIYCGSDVGLLQNHLATWWGYPAFLHTRIPSTSRQCPLAYSPPVTSRGLVASYSSMLATMLTCAILPMW